MSKVVKSSIRNAGKGTINDEIRQKDKAFVLFYTTWCPFSQRFLPIFDEYAKSNSKECIRVIVDDRPDICEEYSIEYYPTVILFKRGEAYGRLDAEPGIGLDKKQLKAFTDKS